ncbi:Sec-independent protein translocase subunit TatA [Pseudonocardia sp.]|jgi:sec-independent protein translocase protein TatA|uniref:Sec-independent protein translocase subunit TatA n=1 Tax=Pseudonocardia sp. TaxID=60912 RepID=UPI00261BDB5F|nr:Sec-independent protein translocase subunit TatA [Pseudonocardia sp.]MCW2718228.1 preprotein translocase subunit SecA [Pseudonocardia sp.]MDT7613468.1 sec-independent protein translocase protein TatA [Pseudonocardiales bacterium]
MGALSPTHWLIIVAVLVLLFGAKRLPDAARSLGRSARILKSEVKELHPDAPEEQAPAAPQASAAALPPATPAPAPAAAPVNTDKVG